MLKIEWYSDAELPDHILFLMNQAGERCMICEGLHLPCAVTVRLCDDETIERINQSFRGISRPTDVLSFPSVSYPSGRTAGTCERLIRREYDDETKSCFLGDLIISVPHIYAQAQEYGHSVEREAAYLFVHGMCHLMGYDHMNENEKRNMRQMEEKILCIESDKLND